MVDASVVLSDIAPCYAFHRLNGIADAEGMARPGSFFGRNKESAVDQMEVLGMEKLW